MISELLSFLSPCCQSDTPDQLYCSASGIWSNKVTTPRPSEKEIAQLHRSKKTTVVTDIYKRRETMFCRILGMFSGNYKEKGILGGFHLLCSFRLG